MKFHLSWAACGLLLVLSLAACGGADTLIPVSYTHLAVYKRQGYHYAGQAEFFFMGFVRENLNCYEKKL